MNNSLPVYNSGPATCRRRKPWIELQQVTRECRRKLMGLSGKVPSNFVLRTIRLPDGSTTTRVYFLSSMNNSRDMTLMYSDVDATTAAPPARGLSCHSLLESNFKSASQPGGGKLSKEEQLQLERKRLVTCGITSFELHQSSGRFVIPASGTLFTCVDSIAPDDVKVSCHMPEELKWCDGSTARLNPQICPVDGGLVAYVANGDIWVQDVVSTGQWRLTYDHKGAKNLADDCWTAGVPPYIIQEEFNRYNGFWWQPTEPTVAQDGSRIYTILYEEVDESEVEIVCLGSSSLTPDDRTVEEFRFPRAGSANAKSYLRLVRFSRDPASGVSDVKHLRLNNDLQSRLSWAEYIVRAGWTPDGQHVWAELLDRSQCHLQLVMMSVDAFVSDDDVIRDWLKTDTQVTDKYNATCHGHAWVLGTQQSNTWINVNDTLHFFSSSEPVAFSTTNDDAAAAQDNHVTFLWANEGTGYCHLYLDTVAITKSSTSHSSNDDSLVDDDDTVMDEQGQNGDCSPERNGVGCRFSMGCPRAKLLSRVALTDGEWEVLEKQLWVDEVNRLVFFMALKDSPLEKHLYVVSLDQPRIVNRLTQLNYSHSVVLNKECNVFVTVYSNLGELPKCEVFSLSRPSLSTDNSVESITVTSLGYIFEPQNVDKDYIKPRILSHTLQSGETVFAMLFYPDDFQPGVKYATVVSVYGGPEVQLVTNSFKGMRQLRSHVLASEGYLVVSVDGRGSRHRGVAFESHIKHKMGTVELDDQVETLFWLSETTGSIDMSRVAIHGWSYGGYLSLMALAHRPDIFKVAIAGAPVTTWNLYDTGYTERYMGLPHQNQQGYSTGSVLSHVHLFPNDENRLLIIHGLLDENVHFAHTAQLVAALVKAGKPYSLQVYPNERHSLRHMDASEHYETTMLSFLQLHL